MNSSINLSIDKWHELSKNNVDLPMRILIYGTSMSPLVRIKKDYVTIIPMKRDAKIGDIVLFRDCVRDRYVLHRVWEIRDNGEKILTFGDHCLAPDALMNKEDVWGLCVKIERGKRNINPDSDKARSYGIKWAKIEHVIYRNYIRFRSILSKIKHKIVK